MNLRPHTKHIIIIDGTLSRLNEGEETNAGMLFKLVREMKPRIDLTIHYDRGIQGSKFRDWVQLAAGIGINETIIDAYDHLARRYMPGDSIYLFGYSRGAYAVRSLAGMIGKIGLVNSQHRTKNRVRRAFRHYEAGVFNSSVSAFSRAYCHRGVNVEMVGVWDTVKALGLPFPLISRFAPMATDYHEHHLGPTIKNAFQALSLDETRRAYRPIHWECNADWEGNMEQRWFAGAHADVGGHLDGENQSRPLSNIPFIWMLEKADNCELPLPKNWQDRFPTDAGADAVGSYSGINKMFLVRARRQVRLDQHNQLHDSVAARQVAIPTYQPKADIIVSDAGH